MPAPTFLLWPYEELRFARGVDDFEYLIATPWLATKIRVDMEGATMARRILASEGQPPDRVLVDCWSRLMQGMVHEPFCYILPRIPPPPGVDQHTLVKPLSDARLAGMWDIESTLAMARLGKTEWLDPLTLMSVFRRFFYLDGMQNDATGALVRRLEGLRKNAQQFRNAAAFLTAQTFYITQRSTEVLSAALPLAQQARPVLQAFIDSEKGHDELLGRALASIGPVDEEWTAPHPLTIELMEGLKKAGEENFLGFCFAVSLFERPDYSSENRYTDILAGGGFKEAAKMLEAHRTINVSGSHEHIGLDMLEFMGPVKRDYAVQAAWWSENIGRLISRHSGALLQSMWRRPQKKPVE